MSEEGVPVAEGRFEIINNLGLHARAATKLVQLASRFACDIEISREGQKANAKSVMGVLLLCGAKGTFLEVTARGPASEEAVQAIGTLIASKFGESA
jgi:phosphocarrier protein HPr